MKSLFIPLLLSLLSLHCRSSWHSIGSGNLVGKYRQQDDKSYELVLNANSSFLYFLPSGAENAEFHRHDTITYGQWTFDRNGMIAVSSPDYLSENLKLEVEEKQSAHYDTVRVEIHNPIEDKSLSPNIEYAVGVLAKGEDNFLEQIDRNRISNIIKFLNPNKSKLLIFCVVVYLLPEQLSVLQPLNYNEGIKVARTKYYGIKNPKSNQFIVNIPDLTEGYFKFRRLKQDLIKVINRNQLEWDGHLFQRELN